MILSINELILQNRFSENDVDAIISIEIVCLCIYTLD